MDIIEKLKNSIVFLDGATGTELVKRGLKTGEGTEEWNVTHRADVLAVNRAYIEAGCDVICANTFGANPIKHGDKAALLASEGVKIALEACGGLADKYVALDVGPTGKLLKPLGDLGFEDAVNAFKRTVKAGADAGAHLIIIETMNDPYELKAAFVAAKETCDLPVIATLVFDEDGKTMTGCTPEAAVALVEGLGAAALGVNCSLAPKAMAGVVKRMLAVASVPVVVKPNAGLPKEVDGRAVYSLGAKEFAADMAELVKAGARVVGGCCGTTPEHIRSLISACKKLKPVKLAQKKRTVISSYSRALVFDAPILIGERINPTGKKRLKEALREGDMAYILGEAVEQEKRGAMALDVNVGLPELDEKKTLVECVREIQAVTELPLQIDTSDPAALEAAMRIYNGKPLVNSVNGKRESMDAVFPLVKKYGGAVICLTLDENGIPPTAAGRLDIAKKIAARAKSYGIPINELIFDTLAMAVSADSSAADVSLEALRLIKSELGAKTSLGISNISFGLPQRDSLTSTYFALALGAGLSAAIYNPYSDEINKTYKAFMALSGRDVNCADYIVYASAAAEPVKPQTRAASLRDCIVKGLKAEAMMAAKALCDTALPLDIINGEIIPALDEVGEGYEKKRIYLPQLLMSAEAASAAFEALKTKFGTARTKSTKVVMATVKGDIHDIGKNIVCTLLRNYGFTVIDLGRDVAPETVVDAVKAHNAEVVGLSALMTTTVAAMKETIVLLRKHCPTVKICVGGAVLTQEYADRIGADKYCKDAMETVRYAEEVEKGLRE